MLTEPKQHSAKLHPLNLLISFAYLKDSMWEQLQRLTDAGCGYRLLIDCGAFTVASDESKRDKINLDAYMRMLSDHRDKIYCYMSFDEIGDAVLTRQNLKTMRSSGFDPVPVFTVGQKDRDLVDMCAETEMVAIGNLGLITPSKTQPFMARLDRLTGGAKLHWLGRTCKKTVAMKPFSIDSTSWMSAMLYGFFVHHQANGNRYKITNGQYTCTANAPYDVESSHRKWGTYPYLARQKWSVTEARTLGLHSWMQFSQLLETKYGTRLHLAFTVPTHVETAVDIYLKLKDEGF